MSNTSASRPLYAEFMDAAAEGQSPEHIAGLLGVPLAVVRLWLSRLEDLAVECGIPCAEDPDPAGTNAAFSGLTLVVSPDSYTAIPGELVTFTTVVMNDTSDSLSVDRLVPGPLGADAQGQSGACPQPFSPEELLGTLPAGDMVSSDFSYRVTEHDLQPDRDLVIVLVVHATTSDGQTLTDECEARVRFRPAGTPSPPTTPARDLDSYSLSGSPTGFSAGQSTSCS